MTAGVQAGADIRHGWDGSNATITVGSGYRLRSKMASEGLLRREMRVLFRKTYRKCYELIISWEVVSRKCLINVFSTDGIS